MRIKDLGTILKVFVLINLIFVNATIAPAVDEYILTEGETIELSDRYYLNVISVDTYYDYVQLSITRDRIVLIDWIYYKDDSFYYDDDYLTLSFDIVKTRSDSYADYVVISNIYHYSKMGNSGSTVIPAVSEKADVDYRPTYVYDPVSDVSSTDQNVEDAVGIVMVVVFWILVFIVARKVGRRIKRRRESKSSSKKGVPSPSLNPMSGKTVPAPVKQRTQGPASSKVESGFVKVKSAFYYKGAMIFYKVKVENHTTEPIGDIRINLLVPDVFMLRTKELSISMLEPDEGKTVTFKIRPTGECGECNVSGDISYYDYNTKKHKRCDMNSRMISIICPVFKIKEVDEGSWRQAVSDMLMAEEDSKDLGIPSENLFDIVTRVLRDMNMYMVKPEITSTPQLFTGVARFYAEGIADMRYAAYVEVVGKRRSRLILKTWAEKEDALTGFYHKMLEEIERRIDIRIFVDEGLTQYNINRTTIQDSVIQRSKIGAQKRLCPQCGREAMDDEKFCMECGAKLE
ncbi:MAG: zinc ribbon domain-containing protein [Methanosarcinaceae archaeon]|nr:zinc ribbon domain-containing protein [Methanosarcinaceae archaeon]